MPLRDPGVLRHDLVHLVHVQPAQVARRGCSGEMLGCVGNIPLIAAEPTRDNLLKLIEQDSDMLAWWGTPVEIAAALAGRERDALLTADEVTTALTTMHALAESWHEIVPSDSIRRTAERLHRAHSLVAADNDPMALELMCLDVRMARAAQRERLVVVGQ